MQLPKQLRYGKNSLTVQDIRLIGTTFPLLRQQTPQPDGGPFLCLSDFVRPLSSGTPDIVGLFASTISEEAEETYKNDPYKHLRVQTLNAVSYTHRACATDVKVLHGNVDATAQVGEVLDGLQASFCFGSKGCLLYTSRCV